MHVDRRAQDGPGSQRLYERIGIDDPTTTGVSHERIRAN
jgi:hypothetical protein